MWIRCRCCKIAATGQMCIFFLNPFASWRPLASTMFFHRLTLLSAVLLVLPSCTYHPRSARQDEQPLIPRIQDVSASIKESQKARVYSIDGNIVEGPSIIKGTNYHRRFRVPPGPHEIVIGYYEA